MTASRRNADQKRVGHGRVTTPAEEAYIGFELHTGSRVGLRIGFDLMAQKADRPAVHFPNRAVALKHDMGIDRLITGQRMAFGAHRPSINKIRTSPEEFRASPMVRPAMDFMTGQTSDHPVV